MTARNPAPPLPHPQPPAAAGQALRDAAQAAAYAWARPTGPAGHARAVSQMYSVLRDLGIAARGLARCRPAGPATRIPPVHAVPYCERPMAAGCMAAS